LLIFINNQESKRITAQDRPPKFDYTMKGKNVDFFPKGSVPADDALHSVEFRLHAPPSIEGYVTVSCTVFVIGPARRRA
jgi:hypothetical protein